MVFSSYPFISSIISDSNKHNNSSSSHNDETKSNNKKIPKESVRQQRCAHEEKPIDKAPLPGCASYAVKFGSVHIVTGALFRALQPSLKASNSLLKPTSPPSSPSSSSSSVSFRFHFPDVEDDMEVCDLPIDSATPSEISSLSASESETSELELDRKPPKQPLPRLVLASNVPVCSTSGVVTERNAWVNTPTDILTPSCVVSRSEAPSISSHSFVSQLETASNEQHMGVSWANEKSKLRRKRGDVTIQQKREAERAELQKQQRLEEAHQAKKAARKLRKLHKTIRKTEDRALANKYDVWPEDKTIEIVEDIDALELMPASVSKQVRAQLRVEERSRGQEKRNRTQNHN